MRYAINVVLSDTLPRIFAVTGHSPQAQLLNPRLIFVVRSILEESLRRRSVTPQLYLVHMITKLAASDYAA